MTPLRLPLIDTHTGGEPTRVIFQEDLAVLKLSLGSLPIETMRILRDQADWIRKSMLLEPRGCESMVGAWVGPPGQLDALASVVFFNNVGYLGMCGHGLIGVIEAMRYRNNLPPGHYKIETVAGIVAVQLHQDNRVEFENVPSERYRSQVAVPHDVPSPSCAIKDASGEIAYGGNWFFILPVAEVNIAKVEEMTEFCRRIRHSLQSRGITGRDGADIDHIELCGPIDAASLPAGTCGSKSFVLCPGGHYDRSPCGTGTSAKLACLAASSDLQAGETWVQQSVIGSSFTARYRRLNEQVLVTIVGRAYVVAETLCVFDPDDAFTLGITHV